MREPQRHVSNSAADRAGDTFRNWMALSYDERREPEAWNRALDAIEVIEAYRAMHSYPLTRVTVGVRSMVRTATRDDSLRPGQRFKRMGRILTKLFRYERMRLSQMEDIGGCRVVLNTLEQVYAVSSRLMRTWRDSARLTDYIQHPKEDGYRGIHIVERRDGRLIEVQLRTPGQQEWATVMEDYSPKTGYNLKDGEGPDDLRRYLRMAADRIARRERGEAPDAEIEEEWVNLREQVRPYFRQD